MSGSGLIDNVNLATFDSEGYGEIRDAAIAWRDGHIAWFGPQVDLPGEYMDLRRQDGHDGWLTPGLVDCHTHIVYAGNRAGEFEARLNGASYQEIAEGGGGIAATVLATRLANEDILLAMSLPRIDTLLAEGVTTLEIKSGYGLDLASERRMLRVARRIGEERALTVRTTFLGAHALPEEYAGRPDDYIDTLCQDWLPRLAGEGLVDAVDAFCERIAFSPAQVEKLFAVADRLGLPVKLHAEQLSLLGGAALAARHGALSADHLEWLDEPGVAAMREAGTVAVLLPGAFYFLRETRRPPVDALRAAGVPMALSTDCNPGTSPLTSLLATANMGAVLFSLTPQEALAGITRHAAQALGLSDRGRIAVGARADLALWDIQAPVDLIYHLGQRPLAACWVDGARRELP
ncbi:MAG: imidazolonepropionase [Paludibacterium sp.]|uniref:imidazolonepropionase n=1 Tax=Paludibacterium sp. TaxID=1917523 RepID=UPI0025F01895|nr:imidazolonepropionase [Paludibacterium sp.]MBV8045663.1 imidazolonepropionase [Paludibacterium sp.]MBV8648514.1 imidazolonepropionase [Paludibacterium sp.]